MDTITFRDQTNGRIADLLTDEGGSCARTQLLLSYISGALLNFRDEGIEFQPEILLCDNIEAVLAAFPGGISYKIGEAELSQSSGPKILKDCGPLSGANWFIFIERMPDQRLGYGVFTYNRLPTAISLEDGITISAAVFALLVRRTSRDTIEMRGARGGTLCMIFSTTRESLAQENPVAAFAEHCASGLIAPEPAPAEAPPEGDVPVIAEPAIDVGQPSVKAGVFRDYLVRLLERALTASHGTILVCGVDPNLGAIEQLQDAIPLRPPLDFYSAFASYHSSGSADAILHLQRCEQLLEGFLRCDGIIVFDTKGRVTAYRVFFRPTAAMVLPPIVGGARRRAYEGAKTLVGTHLVSVLFRSQDGLTLHSGVNQ